MFIKLSTHVNIDDPRTGPHLTRVSVQSKSSIMVCHDTSLVVNCEVVTTYCQGEGSIGMVLKNKEV